MEVKIYKVLAEKSEEWRNRNDHIFLSAIIVCPEGSNVSTTYNCYLSQTNATGYGIEISAIPHRVGVIGGDMATQMAYAASLSNQQIQRKIDSNLRELADTDYKVVRNQELIAVGKEPHYNALTIHAERQKLRNENDKLETQIKDLKSWEELDNILVKKTRISDNE